MSGDKQPGAIRHAVDPVYPAPVADVNGTAMLSASQHHCPLHPRSSFKTSVVLVQGVSAARSGKIVATSQDGPEPSIAREIFLKERRSCESSPSEAEKTFLLTSLDILSTTSEGVLKFLVTHCKARLLSTRRGGSQYQQASFLPWQKDRHIKEESLY